MTIKNVEVAIIDKAWESGFVRPQPPEWLSGRTVAVIGSGPAGLAAAQQLTRAGHTVAVYERADKMGGLLRYGIPEFKMEKQHLDRRLDQMRREGTVFRAGIDVGTEITAAELRERFDAVVLGGGDTGADCLGTSIRQGAASITQLEIMAQPGETRAEGQPWPTYPMLFRVSSAHEEGGERVYAVSTKEFLGDEHGNVRALRLIDVVVDKGTAVDTEGYSVWSSTSVAMWSVTRRTPRPRRASSWRAMRGAVSRSLCGR